MIWLLVVGALALGVGVGWVLAHRRVTATTATPPAATSTLGPRATALLGMLRSGGVVVDADDTVVAANEAAEALKIVTGDRVSAEPILEMVRTARRTGLPATADVTLRRGVGTADQHLTVRVRPVGREVAVLAEDRTAEVRYDESRRDFVANISHELKTPIGAVSILADTINQAAEDPPAVRHFAGRLSRESQRLGDMVAQIIDLSRLQARDPMGEAVEVAVDDLIADARVRTQMLAEQRDIQVVVAGHQEVNVRGDEAQLADAVTNLVQNAIAYSDPGGRVSISARPDRGMVDILVTDNGIGIGPEDQERIFERFYRVDYARSRENGGTGLGLAIVKHVAAVHGGSVHVWSQLGQGSTFTLRLPAGESATVASARQESA